VNPTAIKLIFARLVAANRSAGATACYARNKKYAVIQENCVDAG